MIDAIEFPSGRSSIKIEIYKFVVSKRWKSDKIWYLDKETIDKKPRRGADKEEEARYRYFLAL